jgi:hypothetical protein
LDQSGDKNLCDNNQKIIVAPYDINQSSITIKKIVIAILIYRVTPSKSLSMILGLGKDVSTTTEDVGEEDNGLGGNPSHPVSLL